MAERESQMGSLLKIPEPIVAITGEESYIFETTDEFFKDVQNYLGITKDARVFVERKSFYMSEDYLGHTPLQEEAEVLIVQDLPVASVFHIRNDLNYVQGMFSSYLTPG